MEKIIVNGGRLKIEDVVNVARFMYEVGISQEALEKISKARSVVDRYVQEERIVYGLTTGFGKFCDVYISKEQSIQLQKNLIMSHSCGVGDPLDQEVVRALMLLRVNALSVGYSGIRASTVQTLIDMINKNVVPVIPEKGSLGASGDLAPLSHMVLTMMGMGEAFYKNQRMDSEKAMKLAGIEPVELTSKEGLALINGTQVMTAIAALAVYDAENLSKSADIVSSITIQALKGIVQAFDPKVHDIRNQQGQIKCAANLRKLLQGSKLTTNQGEERVQDPYTLRCIPQIHGASKDAVEYVRTIVEREINAVTDNPLIFAEEDQVISGGNFHGQPIALAMDFLAIALSEFANVSERRIERLVNPQLSQLPAFLTKNGGLNSGFMITQYAAAALVSENKVLAHPASVDSIPSSANQEDHVSMGTIAARKARNILFNVTNVLAIELMASLQAIDIQEAAGKLSPVTREVYNICREQIKAVDKDRVMYTDISSAYRILKSGAIVAESKKILGEIY
ncbi:MAG TPA: histidine ammonia-lyase [Petrotogaceae bacterium]|nr:histidine ammonia-lyase [Petrotogaceae bacterium]HQO11711.1 histidine ammonia-lyase [Petrotogaceae bacterium]HQP57616.1 histidine ammonia-lyase [Petrotogaceae bacterium]